MHEHIEYEFYDGENNTYVDRIKKIVVMSERSGWSRSYTLTFKELLTYAKQWDVEVDLKDSDKTIAKIATNIILANNASEHGLNPFLFVPKSTKITNPNDLEIIHNFEKLLKKNTIEKVVSAMNNTKKQMLLEALGKINN